MSDENVNEILAMDQNEDPVDISLDNNENTVNFSEDIKNNIPNIIQSLDSPPEEPIVEIKQEVTQNNEIIEINWEPNPTPDDIEVEVKPKKRTLDDNKATIIPIKKIKDKNGNAQSLISNESANTKVCVGCEAKTKDISVLLLNFPKHWSAKQIKKCISSNCPTINAILNVSTKIKAAILRVKNFKYVKTIRDAFYGKKVLGNFIYVFVDPTGSVKDEFETQYKLANNCKDTVALIKPFNLKPTARFSLFLPYWTVPSLDVWNKDPKGMYGFKPEFLKRLDIKPPLCCNILVSNIHQNFSVDKIREVFLEAGHIAMIQTNIRSRTAKISYNHPVEAVQAISMFNGSSIFDSTLKVTMDTESSSTIAMVKNMGPGLGLDKQPTKDIQMLLERMILAQYMNDPISPQKQQQKVPDNHTYMNAFGDVCSQLDTLIRAIVSNTLQARSQTGPNIAQQPNNFAQNQSNFAQSNSGPSNFIPNNSGLSNFIPNSSSSSNFNPNNTGLTNFNPNNSGPSNFNPNNTGPSNFNPNNTGPSNFNPNNTGPTNFNPNNSLHAGSPNYIPNNYIPNNNPGPSNFVQNMTPNSFPGPKIFGPNQGQMQKKNFPFNNNIMNQNRPNVQSGNFGPNSGVGSILMRNLVTPPLRSNTPVYNKKERDSPSGNKSDMVVFEGMPDSVNRRILEDKMQLCGGLKFAEITSRGRAFVKFETEMAAAKCIALFDNSRVDGCVISARYF